MLWECKVEEVPSDKRNVSIDLFGIDDKISDYDAEDLYQKLINITVEYCGLTDVVSKYLGEQVHYTTLEKLKLELEDVMDEKIHPFVQGFIRAILNELEELDPNLAVINSKIDEVEKIFELGGYEECLK